MLHAGLDLGRRRIGVCLLSGAGEVVDGWASPPDADGLRGVAARAAMWGPAVGGVIESMNGAQLVRDRLEEHGWEVLIADAAKVKGLAPLACKADRIDARVLAALSGRDLVAEIWLPDRSIRRVRALARVSAASRPASRDAEEPRPRGADRVRSPVPGLGSVWSAGPRAA
jgi:transposase